MGGSRSAFHAPEIGPTCFARVGDEGLPYDKAASDCAEWTAAGKRTRHDAVARKTCDKLVTMHALGEGGPDDEGPGQKALISGLREALKLMEDGEEHAGREPSRLRNV